MIPAPKPLDWGPSRLQEWLEELRVFCIQSRLIAAFGGALDESANGQVLNIPAAAALASAMARPFEATLTPGQSASQLILSVNPGTVNQILAGNIYDEFTISTNGIYCLIARAYSDGRAINSATILCGGNYPAQQVPTPFALPSQVDVLLYVIIAGVAFRTIGPGSVNLTGSQQFITQADSQPGALPYIPYFAWVATE